MTESVRDMTTAIASGDTEAFARFYKAWFDVAFAEARRLVRNDEQFCLDVVQETMMRVIRNMKPIDDEIGVRRWLRVVVQSCCYDALRRSKRRSQREQSRASGIVGAQQSSSATAADDDLLQWLRAELASLPPDEAHLLTLRFRLGWTLQRIGQSLKLKPGAVDGRINRSLAGLRQRAEERFHEE